MSLYGIPFMLMLSIMGLLFASGGVEYIAYQQLIGARGLELLWWLPILLAVVFNSAKFLIAWSLGAEKHLWHPRLWKQYAALLLLLGCSFFSTMTFVSYTLDAPMASKVVRTEKQRINSLFQTKQSDLKVRHTQEVNQLDAKFATERQSLNDLYMPKIQEQQAKMDLEERTPGINGTVYGQRYYKAKKERDGYMLLLKKGMDVVNKQQRQEFVFLSNEQSGELKALFTEKADTLKHITVSDLRKQKHVEIDNQFVAALLRTITGVSFITIGLSYIDLIVIWSLLLSSIIELTIYVLAFQFRKTSDGNEVDTSSVNKKLNDSPIKTDEAPTYTESATTRPSSPVTPLSVINQQA